jgi:hypothetical protein
MTNKDKSSWTEKLGVCIIVYQTLVRIGITIEGDGATEAQKKHGEGRNFV